MNNACTASERVTRPSHLPGVKRFAPVERAAFWDADADRVALEAQLLTDEASEASARRILDRLMWFCAGACVAAGATWGGLILASAAYPS